MPPEQNDHLNQMKAVLDEIKANAEYEKRLSLLEQDLKNYVKETDIHKMISSKLDKYDEEQRENDINWSAIVQTVIASVVGGLIIYALLRGQ